MNKFVKPLLLFVTLGVACVVVDNQQNHLTRKETSALSTSPGVRVIKDKRTRVRIEGVGTVEFPPEMSVQDIAAAIENNFLPAYRKGLPTRVEFVGTRISLDFPASQEKQRTSESEEMDKAYLQKVLDYQREVAKLRREDAEAEVKFNQQITEINRLEAELNRQGAELDRRLNHELQYLDRQYEHQLEYDKSLDASFQRNEQERLQQDQIDALNDIAFEIRWHR